jgi:prepilin-type N-terminal cleavage/methylation domain-containing protein/prepilin-type processing-associated H-X9-DG protein
MPWKKAFTLIELLVVVSIIALLVSILLPALGLAKELSKTVFCRTNLRSLGNGMVLYQGGNNGLVVPSYNMTGTNGGPDVPLDGWGPILDRDKLIAGNRANSGSLLVCPCMKDIEGMKDGQTGSDPDRPKGWMDWPNTRNGTSNIPLTIPERGFNRILRVAYWINAFNPIGSVTTVENDVFYTTSVGYGVGSNGLYCTAMMADRIKRPQQLIALADGVYAGRQRDDRIGTTNSRIGYRHPGKVGTANAAFADGHVAPIEGDEFPRGTGGSAPLADIKNENLYGLYSVYADPQAYFGQ